MKQTRTELHTHLMGMLSAKELLNMISEYTDVIYWPLYKSLGDDSKLVSISSLLDNEDALDQLRIKHGKQVDYPNLSFYYDIRGSLISYLVSIVFLNKGKVPVKYNDLLSNEEILNGIIDNNTSISKNQDINIFKAMLNYAKIEMSLNEDLYDYSKKVVYSDYVNRCLSELIDKGCKYVEISYSYEDIISLIDINPEISKEINCKFLLSTGRGRPIREMKRSAKSLELALSKGMTVGFDIMGVEDSLTDLEKTYDTTNNSKSFKRKLEILIETLIKDQEHKNTLRIHSGESRKSYDNTEWVLNTLKEIKEDYRVNQGLEILPPPELRIGHGLYFRKSQNYIDRLREFEAIIEINASSNFGLNNVDSYKDIPYDYYLENGIPVVIATDGHGLYDTDIRYEDYIASIYSNHYDIISVYDKYVLEGKMRR